MVPWTLTASPSCGASRCTDVDFAGAAARHGLARGAVLLERLAVTVLDPQRRALVDAQIRRLFGIARASP